MVERYDLVEDGRLGMSHGGRWVRYEDYAKLASLCGRMATLLDDLTIKITGMDERTARELIAEWEAMK